MVHFEMKSKRVGRAPFCPKDCKGAIMADDSRLLTFIEMNGFLDEWFQMGLTDDDLERFQTAILAVPKSSPVVEGTAGFRILEMSGVGPTNAMTIQLGYVYFEEFGIVLLVMARWDNLMMKLTAKGKASIASLIARQAAAFAARPDN
jgi:hypothetical protein